ncbi:hypothetical protein D6827_03450 [Candidatus Parcubacteria bacterium]|nr:MAG: hypothetical protein D6827_03450 [Candidatus Parcubacteria bacterium]
MKTALIYTVLVVLYSALNLLLWMCGLLFAPAGTGAATYFVVLVNVVFSLIVLVLSFVFLFTSANK